MKSAVENMAALHPELDYVTPEQLGLDLDEREAGLICNLFFNMVGDPIVDGVAENIGIGLECGCGFGFSLRRLNIKVNFGCGTDVCTDFLEDFVPDDYLPLPVTDLCLAPSLGATLFVGFDDVFQLIGALTNPEGFLTMADIKTELCTNEKTENVDVNLTAIETDLLGVPAGTFFNDTMLSLTLPKICATVEHDLTKIDKCSIEVAGEDCPCTVCGDFAIQLDCNDILDEYIPEMLNVGDGAMYKDDVLDALDDCQGVSVINGNGDKLVPSFVGLGLEMKIPNNA